MTIRRHSRGAKALPLLLAALCLSVAGCTGTAGAGDPGGEKGGGRADAPATNEFGGESLAEGEPVRGGSLTVGLPSALETLDPSGPVNAALYAVAPLVYDTLMTLDAEGQAVPELVETFDSSDGGTTWTMRLPSGVTFHDGTPFDADAVLAHLTRVAGEGSRSQSAGHLRQVATMAAPDDRTVTFTLKAPWTGFGKVFTRGSAAYVPSPTAVAELGEQLALTPVGAGPYTVESFRPGSEVVLARNPDYRDPELPYLDELVFVTATDSKSRIAATQTGDLDLTVVQSELEARDAEEGGLLTLRQPTYQYTNILLNLSRPPFDDPRIRRALLQAIDRDGLSAAVFDGQHEPMVGFFNTQHPFYTETDWPEHDPDAARAVVEGYRAETGEDLAFTLTTPQPPDMQRQAAVVQQMLGDVGVEVTLEPGDQPSMVSAALAGTYDAQLRYIGVLPETDMVLQQNFWSRSSGNNGGAGDAELDALIERSRVATGAQRAEVYAQMQQRLTAWMPMLPLLANSNAFVLGPEVGGFPGATGHGVPEELDYRRLWATS